MNKETYLRVKVKGMSIPFTIYFGKTTYPGAESITVPMELKDDITTAILAEEYKDSFRDVIRSFREEEITKEELYLLLEEIKINSHDP